MEIHDNAANYHDSSCLHGIHHNSSFYCSLNTVCDEFNREDVYKYCETFQIKICSQNSCTLKESFYRESHICF